MICAICGGLVYWQGPFSNMTHTQCCECGAINSQHTEEEVEDD